MLCAAYERRLWWFEMLDFAHKLLLVAILAFLPQNAQMAVGMVRVFARDSCKVY